MATASWPRGLLGCACSPFGYRGRETIPELGRQPESCGAAGPERLRHVDTPEPQRFAEEWISAWNARDVDAVLTYYAEDVLFTSPTAQRVVPGSGGTVRGKQALRNYWTRALEGNRDLHFELVGVYHGVDTIVLHYRNQLGGLVNEVLTFRDGLVAVGHATHLQS
jgi:ketosteroid isomerase-like protein